MGLDLNEAMEIVATDKNRFKNIYKIYISRYRLCKIFLRKNRIQCNSNNYNFVNSPKNFDKLTFHIFYFRLNFFALLFSPSECFAWAGFHSQPATYSSPQRTRVVERMSSARSSRSPSSTRYSTR